MGADRSLPWEVIQIFVIFHTPYNESGFILGCESGFIKTHWYGTKEARGLPREENGLSRR